MSRPQGKAKKAGTEKQANLMKDIADATDDALVKAALDDAMLEPVC